MDPATRNPRWAKWSRWLSLILGGIVILSLVDLILAIVWGTRFHKLPARVDMEMPSSSYVVQTSQCLNPLTYTSKLVFYAGTLPFLTLIWAAISLGLTMATVLAPIAALMSSIAAFCCWIPQVGIWLYCEVGAPNVNEHVPQWCPTSSINTASNSYDAVYSVGLGKDFLGLVIAIAIIASIVLAAIAKTRQGKGATTAYPLKTVTSEDAVLPS